MRDLMIVMDEERYSNRVLDKKFDDQTRDLKEHMELVTKPILEQVLKTNGRVTRAEDDIVNYKVWRGWMTGGMAVIMIILPLIVSLITYITLKVINFDNRLQAILNESSTVYGNEESTSEEK